MRGGRLADLSGFRYRYMYGQNRARTVRPICRLDPATLRLNEAAANRQAETGSRATPILCLDAIEFIEDAFQIGGRDTRPVFDNLARHAFTISAGAKFN